MSFTSINFAQGRPLPLWVQLGLAVSLCVAGAGIYRYDQARQVAAEATVQLRKLKQLARQQSARVDPTPVLPKEQVQAVNQAVAALNTPWPAIMGAIEKVRPAKVSLTRLEPRTKDQVVLITAQAESMEELIGFMQALASTAPFSESAPVRQEIVTEGAAWRKQATFEARWEVR